MRRPVPEAGMPSLSEQLAMLSPTAKVVGGSVMVVLGAASFVLDRGSLASWILVGLAAALGAPLLWRGCVERAAARAVAAELALARAELPGLRLEVADAVAEKRGVDQFLRDRGYTTAKARRWIALECGIVLPQQPE